MNIILKFKQMFAVPTFADEDQTRRGRVVHFILIVLVVSVVAFAIGIPLLAPERLHRLPIVVIILLFLLAHLVLLRRGNTRIASISLPGLLWIAVTWANFTSGGIRHPGYGAYVVIVGIAALILNGRWALGFAGLSTGAGLIMIVGEDTGFIDVGEGTFPPITIWLIQTTYFFVTAMLIHYAAENIYQALQRVRANEQLLAERNRQLEQEIARREEAEEKNLKLALERERFEVLRQLVDELSHDLKIPLSIINTSLYLLEQINDPQQQKAKITLIRMQTERLKEFVQDILTLSRLDHIPEFELEPMDVNKLLNELEEQFRPICEKKSLELSVELKATRTFVKAKGDELYRAILNLLQNAVNYTGEGGLISVRTHNHNGSVVIAISDTGIGIAAHDLPRIFDRFYRSDKARTADDTGSGLGLSIVKKVVEIHDGEVSVDSEEGNGTKIQVKLPLFG